VQEARHSSVGRDVALAYRADIDGLRAIAILAVVLYHFGIPGVGGGFVGVDVFFVISGFLITAIISAEMRAGVFSLVGFYERRVRRLLPTLAVVLVVVLVAGFVVMPALDLKRLAASAFYALVLGANFYFADQGSYFEATLGEVPLLHLWSLAVEEQFYLAWPLLLYWAIRRRPAWLPALALMLAGLSLLAAMHATIAFPVEGFFLPHTRAYELLAGSLLALGAVPPPGRRIVADGASLAGLGLIAIAIATYDQQTELPGAAGLLPVAGACLVIWSSLASPSIGGRMLSLPPLVLIGLVSYAWYLWHWPLLAYFRYLAERGPEPIEAAVLIVVSFLLALASWLYLERPIRMRRGGLGRVRLFASAGVVSSVLLLAAGGIALGGGLPGRFGPEVRALDRERLDFKLTGKHCESQATPASIRAGEVCSFGGTPRADGGVLLWGDSHAWALRPAFAALGERYDRTVSYLAATGCPPLIEAWPRKRRGRSEACAAFNRAVVELIRKGGYRDVVLAARWSGYTSGPSGASPTGRQRALQDAASQEASVEESLAVMERGLARTIAEVEAAGARAWIVLEVPDTGYDVPIRLARRLIQGEGAIGIEGPTRAGHDERGRWLGAIVERLGERHRLRTIDPADRLCDATRCLAAEGGAPLYRDDNHLSALGARRLAPLMRGIFADPDTGGGS
jgi:peptidoglycan/LPS O-acetylase OafA/YrhL